MGGMSLFSCSLLKVDVVDGVDVEEAVALVVGAPLPLGDLGVSDTVRFGLPRG